MGFGGTLLVRVQSFDFFSSSIRSNQETIIMGKSVRSWNSFIHTCAFGIPSSSFNVIGVRRSSKQTDTCMSLYFPNEKKKKIHPLNHSNI